LVECPKYKRHPEARPIFGGSITGREGDTYETHRHEIIPMKLFPALLLSALIIPFCVFDALAEGRWQQIENNPKCSLWNRAPVATDSVFWTGPCIDGIADGYGTRYWRWKENGEWREEFFTGTMSNGKLEGIGTYRSSMGALFTGNLKHGKKHGKGQYLWASGSKFVGEYSNNKRNGKGLFTWKNGSSYNGHYKDGVYEGYGVLNNRRGSYKGNFQAGKKHGYGKMSWQGGSSYEGDWKRGKMSGKGTIIFSNGDQMVGTFINGMAQGDGSIWIDGIKRYAGRFEKMVTVEGQGVYFDEQGNSCEITEVVDSNKQAGTGLKNGIQKKCVITHGFQFEYVD